jgi:DNA replication protein DnaC
VRFKDATMGSLNSRTFRPVFEYSKQYRRYAREGVGLLLAGPPGVGKSFATVALTRHVFNGYSKQQLHFDYEFITTPSLFEKIPVFDSDKAVMDKRRSKTWWDTLVEVPWLVINDLGKELRTGGLHDQVVFKLGRLLRERSEHMRVTHVTTNFALKTTSAKTKTIESVYGDSIWSLLKEMTKGYHVNGPDLRSTKGEE